MINGVSRPQHLCHEFRSLKVNPASYALLVPGYAVALAVIARLLPVLRERRAGWFAALQVATAALVAGHLLAGRAIAALINAMAFAAFAIAWWCTGRRRPPPPV